MEPTEDRRQHARRVGQEFRIHAARFRGPAGASTDCSVHVQEASLGGLRVHSDAPFPEGPFTLTLFMQEPWEGEAEVAWRKQIVPGVEVQGLRFEGRSLEDEEAGMDVFLDRYFPLGRRSLPRVDRQVSVEMLLGDSGRTLSAFTLDVSGGGLRVIPEDPLPEETEITFRVFLELGSAPVEAVGRVAWQEDEEGVHTAGVRFDEVSERVRGWVEAFVVSALTEDLARRQALG